MAAALLSELQRLVGAIADGDGSSSLAETFDEAARALSALRDLKLGGRSGLSCERGAGPPPPPGKQIPEHFLCPISSEIMRDPVVLESGQTYDRPFIEEWLSSGNRTCPQTQQVLSCTALIPNHLVRSMISEWCTKNQIDLPPPEHQDGNLVTDNERATFNVLLDKISSTSAPSLPELKQAVRDLRLLTKCNRSFRAIAGENPVAISRLLSALSEPGLWNNPEVLEDTVTTVLNLSIHDSNKKIIGDNARAIPLLIDALKSGNMDARTNSAAALFSLSALDSNKSKIGEAGAMRPLIELLEHGSLGAKKDSASAIFNLCLAHENKARAVREGAIDVALNAIMDKSLVDEALAILALLSSDQEAAEAIGDAGGVPCLLRVLRESPCKRNKENVAVVLYAVCMYDRRRLKETGEDEGLHGTLAWVAQNGTSRARRKAAGILEKLKKIMHSNTHYSC